VVEPGASRLYLVLSAYESTIWRFEGATSRVGQVVLLGAGRQAVTGIAPEGVADLSGGSSEVPWWYEPEVDDGVAARKALERQLGRSLDAFVGQYTVGTLAVPSMDVTMATSPPLDAPPGFDWITWLSGVIFRPGGLAEVDPAAVTPVGVAEVYDVLPQGFGLAQLVGAGLLENRSGSPIGGSFYIGQPIARFPAGLHGAHAVTFVLGAGVPLPPGDPGHSCVVSEETGLPVAGTFCPDLPPVPGGECTMPAALPDDEVVVFGAYEGDAISTTTVAGQDEVTTTIRVDVAPGTSPLYVVLSAFDSTIWRFEGDTARVRQVVLVGVRAQGVTGIDAARVADQSLEVGMTTEARCFAPFYDYLSPAGVVARAAVASAIGRSVDRIGGAYSVGSLAVPALEVTASMSDPFAIPEGFDLFTYMSAVWFSPGGVVEIEPGAVVPIGAAEPYAVLPQGFGIARLVGAGLLLAREGYFYIGQAIPRFPAGLSGAHSVTFVLGSGVPIPPGDPGHSCVVSEETGLAVAGTYCRSLPPVSGGSCTMPGAHPDDEVVLFGAYEGDTISTATVAGQDEATTTIRVDVAPGTRPLYVVLSAFDSTIWRFEGDTARVRQVVLVGVRAQGVTGIDAARVDDQSAEVGSLPEARCFPPFWDPLSPEGLAARGVVTRTIGRAVDVFAGQYGVGTLFLPSASVEAAVAPPGTPNGLDPDVYAEALRFVPGGVVEVDPDAVVASEPGEPYVVLPHHFGLAQLVATGALEVRGSADAFPATFYIASPIPRFPAGLHGGFLVSFVLGTGVPMPPGSPGHSCVISEETGEALANESLCFLWNP
jgi:hypothetical protein